MSNNPHTPLVLLGDGALEAEDLRLEPLPQHVVVLHVLERGGVWREGGEEKYDGQ